CQGDPVGQLMTATTLWEFRLQDCSLAAGTCDRFGQGSRSFQDGDERNEWYTITVIPTTEAAGNTVTYRFEVVNANISIMGQPRFEDVVWTLVAELPFPPPDSPSAADLIEALSLAVTIHHDINNTIFEIQWNGSATTTEFGSCSVVPAQLTIDDVVVVEGDGGTTDFVFTVSRDQNQTEVSVTAQTLDGTAQAGSDYTSTGPTVLAFPAGGTFTQTLAVPVAGETLVELDESFSVELSNPVNAVITDGSGLGTITNDDAATLAIADVAGDEGSSGGSTPFDFVVTLDAAVDTGVAVDFATVDGTAQDENGDGDYTAAQGTLSFAGTAGETAAASVQVAADTRPEQDEEFSVDLFGVAAGGRDVTLADDRGAGTIADDDDACPGFAIYQQPFDSPAVPRGHPATAGAGATFEDVVDEGGTVTTLPPGPVSGLRLWGLGVRDLGDPCPLDPAVPFDLVFAADAAGVPGAVLATRTAVEAAIVPLSPEVAQLDLVFPTIDGDGVAWISVQRPEADGCAFQWLAEETAGTYDDIVFTPPASAPDDAYLCVGDPHLFGDGFESGDTSAWSVSVP
ncbi:MAG: hypothetical protein L0221_00400, partial [Chloroflexi bacterium]|nr:hypothetical protein [Chloroflexota bacterium]